MLGLIRTVFNVLVRDLKLCFSGSPSKDNHRQPWQCMVAVREKNSHSGHRRVTRRLFWSVMRDEGRGGENESRV